MSDDPTKTAQDLNALHADVAAGIEVSPERYALLIAQVRQARISASRPTAGTKKKGTVTHIDPDGLVPDLV